MTDLFGETAFDTVEIRLDGQPIGKGRPRFSRKSGTPYTPERTQRYEDRLAWAAQEAMRGRKLLEGPLSVSIMAFMEAPKSWSQKKRAAALRGEMLPTTKPDFDNIAKMVDALKRVVWIDDAQVVHATILKHYSDRPRLEISVRRA